MKQSRTKHPRKIKHSRTKELLPYLTLTLISLVALFFISGYTGFVTQTTSDTCNKYDSCEKCTPSANEKCGWLYKTTITDGKCMHGNSSDPDSGTPADNKWVWYTVDCLNPKTIELNKEDSDSSTKLYSFKLEQSSIVTITLTMDSKDDFDLYVGWDGKRPKGATSETVCRPYYDVGIKETCKHSLDKGTYYIFVDKISGSGKFKLNVSSKDTCNDYKECKSCTPSVGESCGWSIKQGKCMYGTSSGSDDKKTSTGSDWIWETKNCPTTATSSPPPPPALSPTITSPGVLKLIYPKEGDKFPIDAAFKWSTSRESPGTHFVCYKQGDLGWNCMENKVVQGKGDQSLKPKSIFQNVNYRWKVIAVNYDSTIDVTELVTFATIPSTASIPSPTVGAGASTTDKTPPTGSVKINNEEATTSSTPVTLTLSCTDASGCSQMKFSTDDSTWSNPEDYLTPKSWTLTSGGGTKTIYVRFKDKVENWMDSSAKASIILSTTTDIKPTVSQITTYTICANGNTPIQVTGTDDKGVSKLDIDFGDGAKDSYTSCPSGTSCTNTFLHTYTSTGAYTIKATATDSPGGQKSDELTKNINVVEESACYGGD